MKYGKTIGLILSGAGFFVACGSDEGTTTDTPERSVNGLVSTDTIEAGSVCEFGGTQVQTGLDADDDGSLSGSEVTNS